MLEEAEFSECAGKQRPIKSACCEDAGDVIPLYERKSIARNGRYSLPPHLGACGQFVDRIPSTRRVSDGKECQRLQNAKEFLVAATFEKSKTYVFDGLVIMNPTL